MTGRISPDSFHSHGFAWQCPPRRRPRRISKREHCVGAAVTLAFMALGLRWGLRLSEDGPHREAWRDARVMRQQS